MKYCAEYALDLFVDGELSEEEAARVRAHLKVCGACRSYVAAALAIRDAFPGEEDAGVPEDFAGRVMAAVRTEAVSRTEAVCRKRPAPWKKALLPMAACLAIVIAAGQLPRYGSSAATADTAYQGQAASEPASSLPAEAESESAAEDTAPEESTPAAAASQSAEENQFTVFSSGREGADIASIKDGDANGAPRTELAATDSAKVLPAPEQEYSRWARVSLTEEQAERLLGAYAAQAWPDGSVCYELTAEQFDAAASALEEEGVQLDIRQNGEADPDACCLILPPEE